MKWSLYLLLALWTVFGAMALLFPKKVKALKGLVKPPYWLWSLILLVFAYFLWQAQSLVTFPWIIQAAAIIAAIKGLFMLVLPKNKLMNWLGFWLSLPELAHRVIGVLVLLLAYYLWQALI